MHILALKHNFFFFLNSFTYIITLTSSLCEPLVHHCVYACVTEANTPMLFPYLGRRFECVHVHAHNIIRLRVCAHLGECVF